MLQEAPVIRDTRQLAQITRLGCILRLPQQELLLQAEAALHQVDELQALIGQEKIRSMDQLQTYSWCFSLQGSLSGLYCRINSRFYDSRSDRHSVRLRVYSRAAALCRSSTPQPGGYLPGSSTGYPLPQRRDKPPLRILRSA